MQLIEIPTLLQQCDVVITRSLNYSMWATLYIHVHTYITLHIYIHMYIHTYVCTYIPIDVPRFVHTEYGEGLVSQYTCCGERRGSLGCQIAKVTFT